LDIEGIIDSIPSNSIVLLDCLTTLLTNEIFTAEKIYGSGVEERVFRAIYQLMDKAKVLIVVSNELLHDIPSETGDILQFQRTLGRLHRKMVEKSCTAVDMTVGIPVLKKKVHLT
jgi:adenosylcobinamide kinase / adenosylcobinamide-phosphate guanylyltransferase